MPKKTGAEDDWFGVPRPTALGMRTQPYSAGYTLTSNFPEGPGEEDDRLGAPSPTPLGTRARPYGAGYAPTPNLPKELGAEDDRDQLGAPGLTAPGQRDDRGGVSAAGWSQGRPVGGAADWAARRTTTRINLK